METQFESFHSWVVNKDHDQKHLWLSAWMMECLKKYVKENGLSQYVFEQPGQLQTNCIEWEDVVGLHNDPDWVLQNPGNKLSLPVINFSKIYLCDESQQDFIQYFIDSVIKLHEGMDLVYISDISVYSHPDPESFVLWGRFVICSNWKKQMGGSHV